MGYAISLNLIHEPETDDVDGLLSSLFSARWTGSSGPSRTSARTASGPMSRNPDLPVPVMLVGGMDGQTTLPVIGIDNLAIGRLATEHLLAGGARHRDHHGAAGLVGGAAAPGGLARDARQRPAADRRPGGRRATGPPTAASRASTGSSQCPDLDAVFAWNDQMALGVLHGAHRLGRRVPEDLSVIGVDNIAEASHSGPRCRRSVSRCAMPGHWRYGTSTGRSASPASTARRMTGPRGLSCFSRSLSSAAAVGPSPRRLSGADPAAGNRLATKVVDSRAGLGPPEHDARELARASGRSDHGSG